MTEGLDQKRQEALASAYRFLLNQRAIRLSKQTTSRKAFTDESLESDIQLSQLACKKPEPNAQ